MILLLEWVWAVDVTAEGRVLVSADYNGLVMATDMTTKTKLWSKKMDASVFTLRIHNRDVFVPVLRSHVHVLDVMTGDVLRRYPALSGETRGLVVIPGELTISWSLLSLFLTIAPQPLSTRWPCERPFKTSTLVRFLYGMSREPITFCTTSQHAIH